MAVTENGNGLSAADVAAVTGNGNGNGLWGDGSFWIIILFLFALMGNGWGGNFGGNGMMPYMMTNNTYADVQRGFDQQAVINGITGLTNAVNTGFSSAEVANNARQMANMQQLNTIAMNQQACCCENRAAVEGLRYTVATEACADRAAVGDALNTVLNAMNAGIQGIKDQMCQDKIDSKNERIAALENQLNMAQLRESQTAQTAQILAHNTAQTQALEQYLNPTAIPAYIVQNPNCCANNFGCGCNA